MEKVIKSKSKKRIVLGKNLLEQAGLGEEIEIIVQDGAILVLSAVKPDGWKALQALGEDPGEGNIENPSINHDRYLYGDQK
ncbi:MAG: hypothetical protein Q9P14_05230 [candidate division KSB1 bacterium]|nr:hypothetical protein [candidate division KSB1 bacterium]MDQ7065906.1 hypothetical protein [candidate division KSB1 bacterium]